jgi:hypothetical protein
MITSSSETHKKQEGNEMYFEVLYSIYYLLSNLVTI